MADKRVKRDPNKQVIKAVACIKVCFDCLALAKDPYGLEYEVFEWALEQIIRDKTILDNNKEIKWRKVQQAFVDSLYEWAE